MNYIGSLVQNSIFIHQKTSKYILICNKKLKMRIVIKTKKFKNYND